MKKQGILSKLKRAGKLKIVEPSEDICGSYLKKADNCLLSAKILLQNNIYENSVSESYYAMYNSLTALLYRTGIKCENHTASIILLKRLFDRHDLSKIISKSKKERIDKQYYVESENFVSTKEAAKNMAETAEKFLVEMKLFIGKTNTANIDIARNKFSEIFSWL